MAVAAQVQRRSRWRDLAGRPVSGCVVAARGQTCRLPGSIQATHLHGHRSEAGQADDQDRNQSEYRESGLGSGGSGFAT